MAAGLRGTGEQSQAFVDEAAARIALGVSAVAAVLDPGLVVLSGETGLAGGARLAAAVAEHGVGSDSQSIQQQMQRAIGRCYRLHADFHLPPHLVMLFQVGFTHAGRRREEDLHHH